ncbi:MAG: SagB/ThcOx family dehydrogenase [Bacteriovoracaceae bacterium]|jgi:SagB-type dehydrogenase family enzyme|nr:SagB/ThcOx family dehydrogenase [Bacteriovoracaceae bacterium]
MWPLLLIFYSYLHSELFSAVGISLPRPIIRGKISIEETISNRRTYRSFARTQIALSDISQLLWSGQGITGRRGNLKLRSSPSAGALYPLNLYLIVRKGSVKNVEGGTYLYQPITHSLKLIAKNILNKSHGIPSSVLQPWMNKSGIKIMITGQYSRSTKKYGKKGRDYTLMEVGHVSQNILLQAQGLLLKAGMAGAFDRPYLQKYWSISKKHLPLMLIAIGKKRYKGM